MIWLIFLVVAIILFILAIVCEDNFWGSIEALCFGFSFLFCFFAILTGLSWFSNKINYESNIIEYQQTRTVLVDELQKYDKMREKDVTGSTTYLDLQKEIIDFNHNVNLANSVHNILLDHSIIDPAYREVEPIPIQVG